MELNFGKLVAVVILSTLLLDLAECLECYACSNQDSNKDKCIKTSKQCEEHHDTCMTTVAWALPPYWTPYGDRMHYVWKDCATRAECNQRQDENARFCKRDWYDDWSCVACCAGDLCNYYVTLDASSTVSSHLVLCGSLMGAWLLSYGR